MTKSLQLCLNHRTRKASLTPTLRYEIQWHHGSMSAKTHECTITYHTTRPDFHQKKTRQGEKGLQCPCTVTFLLGVIEGTGQLSVLYNTLVTVPS